VSAKSAVGKKAAEQNRRAYFGQSQSVVHLFASRVCDGVQKRKAAQPRVNRDPATPWGKRRAKESFGLSKAAF